MKYYISDLHFFHENVLRFDSRPYSSIEEMNKNLVENWNDTIKQGDEIYFLGDFSFGKNPQTIDIIRNLSGIKYLVKGNHDGRYLKDIQFKNLWNGIFDIFEVDDTVDNRPVHITLCHYPILSFKGRYRENFFHFYGHIHNSKEEKLTIKFANEISSLEKETNSRAKSFILNDNEMTFKMYNVGCMMPYMNYKPQSAETIIKFGEEYCRGVINEYR